MNDRQTETILAAFAQLIALAAAGQGPAPGTFLVVVLVTTLLLAGESPGLRAHVTGALVNRGERFRAWAASTGRVVWNNAAPFLLLLLWIAVPFVLVGILEWLFWVLYRLD